MNAAIIQETDSQVMTPFQSYLSQPKVRKALTLKPGDKGFSLIELVVVVAVLAILAAIAVPAYMGMNEQAADSAMETNLKNAYKECAYQLARGSNNRGLTYPNFDMPGDDGYYTYSSNAGNSSGNSRDCYSKGSTATTLTATKANATNTKINGAYTINVLSGGKSVPSAGT